MTDRGKAGLVAFVERLLRRTDFHALYPARAIAQNADGTLELVVDGDRMPGMSHVPIRYGVPGVAAKVKKDARVLVGFEGGDPRRPVATLWDAASVTELTITATGAVKLNAASVELTAAAGPPVARKGDLVSIGGGPSPLPVPPTPNAFIQFAIKGLDILPGVPIPVTFKFGPLPTYGVVTSGNVNVKA